MGACGAQTRIVADAERGRCAATHSCGGAGGSGAGCGEHEVRHSRTEAEPHAGMDSQGCGGPSHLCRWKHGGGISSGRGTSDWSMEAMAARLDECAASALATASRAVL